MRKAYDDFKHERCLEILVAYGVGLQIMHLLRAYWERPMMLDQSGRYYGDPFKGNRGVLKGEPMYPAIFNMVVDTVIHHWATVVAGNATG